MLSIFPGWQLKALSHGDLITCLGYCLFNFQISGAKVTIFDPKHGSAEGTVIISIAFFMVSYYVSNHQCEAYSHYDAFVLLEATPSEEVLAERFFLILPLKWATQEIREGSPRELINMH